MSRVNYYQSAFKSQTEKLNILLEMLEISKSRLPADIYTIHLCYSVVSPNPLQCKTVFNRYLRNVCSNGKIKKTRWHFFGHSQPSSTLRACTHSPLTLEFNLFNFSRLFHVRTRLPCVRTDYASL